MSALPVPSAPRHRFLPAIGSPAYHLLLAAVAILVLGPLGGVSAAFMNFSIGFFVGGQVLAGILGSTVTLPYGPEGRHGANYIQTMAASVAGMCGMAILVQAMVWLGLEEPPAWQLVLFLMCMGMFGVGVGMLYTPILVDRMQLAFPSGFAVANILRALTDRELLRRSVAKLGGGMTLGYAAGIAALKVAAVGATSLSISTIGAGMIVGARIAIPALVVALLGWWQTPYLREIGWLESDAPFRKIGFIISLGSILGAAALDIVLILIEAAKRYAERRGAPVEQAPDWKRVNMMRLFAWVAFWGVALVIVGNQVLHQPLGYLIIAVLLSFVFVLINGISLGISDWNPISSAFVLTVFVLAAVGLRQPIVGLMCGGIVMIACSVGGDMQQDRSTGWRLGTNRVVQFRYQVIGIGMGALLSVVLAKVFLNGYPVLRLDQYSNPGLEGVAQWQSAMTYKLVGALKGITTDQPHVMKALWLGIAAGFLIEVVRKLVKRSAGYKTWVANTRTGRNFDFIFDAVLFCSPYASSFGGFVEMPTVLWWTFGGLIPTFYALAQKAGGAGAAKQTSDGTPEDMGTMSLVGGGMIAGDSLAALTIGLIGLASALM